MSSRAKATTGLAINISGLEGGTLLALCKPSLSRSSGHPTMATSLPNPVLDVVDLSHEISEGMLNMGGWTTAFPVIDTIAKTRTLSQGKMGVASRMILVSEHNGTHLDVPRHFVEDGMPVDQVPLSRLVLPGHLLDFTQKCA